MAGRKKKTIFFNSLVFFLNVLGRNYLRLRHFLIWLPPLFVSEYKTPSKKKSPSSTFNSFASRSWIFSIFYNFFYFIARSWPHFSAHLPKAKPKKVVPKKKAFKKTEVEPSTIFHPLFTYGISLTITGIILGITWATYDFVLKDLPSIENLSDQNQIVSTKILDRKGRELYTIYKDENRTLVGLDDISPYLIQATISIEDKDFYQHFGFSPLAIIRATRANIKGETVQGGSTITQQLVKNTLLTPERTVRRKLKELVLSVVVEAMYSKQEILQMYFNQIPYGGSTYGAEEAAQRYFGKSAHDLDLAESSLLAGLPAAPSNYSPFGTRPELAYTRQAEVLRRMVEDNHISEEEASQAKRQVLSFRNDTTNILAPHFVMYIRTLLAEKYGEEVITQGGLEVRTSLDLDLQQLTQEAVTSEVSKLRRLNVSNGAALVTNPTTGEILAMVGSVNYFDLANDGQVNVTLRPRQPGSSIKPLVYATALELGLQTPASIIHDTPVVYQTVGSPAYSPVNYDGKFHGNVTLRESLASSYNVPAVKTLALVGVNRFINQAQQMGISTWTDRRRFGLSLALGGGEVLMTDMAVAYSSFANLGYSVELNPIIEITNFKGETLYENTCAKKPDECDKFGVLDPRVAYQISNILMDNVARTPAFGPQSVLYIPNQEVAVKTGTTNSLRDNWTIGYTSDRLVATWVGNNDNTPMSAVASGITGASPIWNEIMTSLLPSETPHQFIEPSGLLRLDICRKSGLLNCNSCGNKMYEYFLPGTEPVSCGRVVPKQDIEPSN